MSSDARFPGHAIITGGSSGIGLALAKGLARRGAAVTIMARRPDVLAVAATEIEAVRADPATAIGTATVDVTDRAALAAAIAAAVAERGPPELLVASAGSSHPDHFAAIPDDVFAYSMAVNYFGALHAARCVMPEMVAGGRGRIVFIASAAAIMGIFGYSAYSPAKFALRGLAETLRAELKPAGVGVTIVYPPDVDTPMLAAENATKPAETVAISAGAMVWQPGPLAELILRGIARNRFVIVPGFGLSMLYRFHSLIQPLVNRRLDSVAARARRRSRAP